MLFYTEYTYVNLPFLPGPPWPHPPVPPPSSSSRLFVHTYTFLRFDLGRKWVGLTTPPSSCFTVCVLLMMQLMVVVMVIGVPFTPLPTTTPSPTSPYPHTQPSLSQSPPSLDSITYLTNSASPIPSSLV